MDGIFYLEWGGEGWFEYNQMIMKIEVDIDY